MAPYRTGICHGARTKLRRPHAGHGGWARPCAHRRSDEKQKKGSFKMLKSHIGLGLAGALVLATSLLAIEPASAAEGCGPGWWRGPWGHCRNTPYTGPLPRGGYQVEFRPADNGCPPGFWRGPYGHCRDTPFHGRLPNGNWK